MSSIFRERTGAAEMLAGVADGRFSFPHQARIPRRAQAARSTHAQRYRRWLVFTDSCVILAAVFIGLFVESAVPRPGALPAASIMTAASLAAGWLLLLAIVRSREVVVLGVGPVEYKRVVNATIGALGGAALVCALIRVPATHGLLLVAIPFGLLGLVFSRWLWRQWLNSSSARGRSLSRAIVVGELSDVRYVIERILEAGGPVFSIEGVVLDENDGGAAIVVGDRIVPVIGTTESAPAAAARAGADSVIVAGRPRGGDEYIRSLGWALEPLGAELILSSHLVDVAGPRIHFRPVEGLPLIHVATPRFEGGKHILKRGFDIVAASMGLIAISPLLIVVAVCVKLDSPGPVFFRQRRIGRNGTTFQMLKFRSMVVDAEARLEALKASNEGAGPLFKMKSDPRVTRIGRFLRAHSLDELPQLWNIVRGDMSLVGPRPPLPSEVAEYTPATSRRLFIKPGLTGLWQVSGRSDLDWEQSVRLDLYYVENWSLTGDLVLIWRTIKVIAQPEGAY